MTVTIRDIVEALEAEVLAGEDLLDREVGVVIASDLVSDILCCRDDASFLITGLAKIQILRAADMLDLAGICFVRDKVPDPELVEGVRDMGIPILRSAKTMFEASGLVYALGAKSGVYSPPSPPQ
ncbi:MAG: DRTGG domain-containing protein [Candidatus Zixiibacteriota bacterium]